MALFSLFKQPKHRVFNYQPLYYDERKEALEQLIQNANAASNAAADSENESTADIAARIRGTMRRQQTLLTVKRKSGFSTTRFAIILVALCAIAYYLFIGIEF